MARQPYSSPFATAAGVTPSPAPVKPAKAKAVAPMAAASPMGGPKLKRANAGTNHGLQRMHHVQND